MWVARGGAAGDPGVVVTSTVAAPLFGSGGRELDATVLLSASIGHSGTSGGTCEVPSKISALKRR